MYAATERPNVKWGGTDFKWGGQSPLAPPGDDPVRDSNGATQRLKATVPDRTPCTCLCDRCCGLEQRTYKDADGVRAARFSERLYLGK